jgi:double-stranded uracil-DNA glycosylase
MLDPTPPDLAVGFPPVAGDRPRVLLLGSMPGRASLQASRYYNHPRNLFWPLMGALFGVDPLLPYNERLNRLTDQGVALWDVLARCERPGSLDQAIVKGSMVANPIGAWLAANPTVVRVGLNGSAAHGLFRRLVVPGLDEPTRLRVQILPLPSTSPANAGMSAAAKRAAWDALLGRGSVESKAEATLP